MGFSERRSIERIPVGEKIIITYKNSIFMGTVLNLSKVGMFIGTRISFPSDAVLLIENSLIKILGKVKRTTDMNGYYDGVGVELSEATQDFVEYLNSFKTPL